MKKILILLIAAALLTFGNVNAGTDGLSNNDAGDLVFDTSASKMKVYDGSSWGEVTSTGDFKYLVLTETGTTNAASYDGSKVSFDLKENTTGGSAASVTNAAQLMVSINGVIQKPNTGTNTSGLDGFVMTDADLIPGAQHSKVVRRFGESRHNAQVSKTEVVASEQ